MKTRLLSCSIWLLNLSTIVTASELPAVTHYSLDARFQLNEQRVSVIASLTVKNVTGQTYRKLPFLLYRLLNVDRVDNNAGQPLSFRQEIVPLRDEPSLQVTALTVDLPDPLVPNDSVTIVIRYGGFVFGYPEVMEYVKDRIDENYSLLRPDAFAYPMLAEPTFASVLEAYDTRFTYEVRATVPKWYRVACGGALVDSSTKADSSTFLFRSKVPTWRIDVAVAKFSVLANAGDQLGIYYLPEDSTGAQRVLEAAKNVITFYSALFGRPTSYRGYTIIEIPDGWGSQASDYYFLQSAAAFKDSSRMPEVYHEIGHTWNAMPSSSVKRCRYFDEAFASFFEALAVRAFNGENAFENEMELSRKSFARWAQRDTQVFNTPIADYGAKELGRHSYTKGAWSLYVLYRIAGEKTFAAIIRNMLAEYAGHTINFEQFQGLCERIAKRNLQKFFRDWIFGAAASALLVDKVPIAEILKRYEIE